MKLGRPDPEKLRKEREEKKKREIEKSWELWERYRNKLYCLEAKTHNKRRGQ